MRQPDLGTGTDLGHLDHDVKLALSWSVGGGRQPPQDLPRQLAVLVHQLAVAVEPPVYAVQLPVDAVQQLGNASPNGSRHMAQA